MSSLPTNAYEVPLDARPQTFQIALGSITYTLLVWFNPVLGTWQLDISDAAGVSVIGGLVLVTGTDLLAQHKYLGIPGQLVVWWVGSGQPAAPSFDNLGTDAKLYFIPN